MVATPSDTQRDAQQTYGPGMLKMRDAFPLAREDEVTGWHHNEDNPSFDFREQENGHITIHSWSGRTPEEILAMGGLIWSDIAPHGHINTRVYPKIDVTQLGQAKRIYPNFLVKQGLTDNYRFNGYGCIGIPYFLANGDQHTKWRVRKSIEKPKTGDKQYWDKDTPGAIIPYGLHRLDMARAAGYLLIGEGESDAWACWLHNIPYLGIPGCEFQKCLTGVNLNDIPAIYILSEPDQVEKMLSKGKSFYKDSHSKLRQEGYKGKIYFIDFKKATKHKDPSDLHIALFDAGQPDQFPQIIKQACEAAEPANNKLSKTKPTIARLCDLQAKQLPDTRWAIPDILPEGLTWLVGKPKLGKSWLLLAMLIGIANGTMVLGKIPVEAGNVLYISLEDNEKRLQKRANIVAQQVKVSERFEYATAWPRLDEGGLEQLEEYITAHPDLRIIGIDTWARIKPRSRGKQSGQQYDEDYDALTPLQEMASKYSVSIVLVHHMRKQESEDPLDMISGSTAMQGAVDGFLLLYRKRGETDARLYVNGRDIEEEQDLLLTFTQECATWTLNGDAEENAGTPERQAIIDAMRKHEKPIGMKELATLIDKNYNTTRNLVASLRNENKILFKNNVYSLVNHSQSSQPSQRSQPSQSEEKTAPGIDYDHEALTRVDYASSQSRSQPIKPHAEPNNNTSKAPLTRLTTVTKQNIRIDIPDSLSQDEQKLEQLKNIAQYVTLELKKKHFAKMTVFWCDEQGVFDNASIAPVAYAERVNACLASEDAHQIRAAITAMKRTLYGKNEDGE